MGGADILGCHSSGVGWGVKVYLWRLVGRGQECHLPYILQCIGQILQQRNVWTQMSNDYWHSVHIGKYKFKGESHSEQLCAISSDLVWWVDRLSHMRLPSGQVSFRVWGWLDSGGHIPTWTVVAGKCKWREVDGRKHFSWHLSLCWADDSSLICFLHVCGVLPLLRTLPLAPLTPVTRVGAPPGKVQLYFHSCCWWRSMSVLHGGSKKEGRPWLPPWQSLLIL